MAPTSAMLQGLNVISNSPQSISDPNDLGDEPLSHDFAAQLDLWSSVNFAQDEPLPIHSRDSLDGLETGYDAKTQSKRQATVIDPALQSPTATSSFFNYDSFLPAFSAGADAFSIAPGYTNAFYPASSSSGANSIVDSSSLDVPQYTPHPHGPTLSSLNTTSTITHHHTPAHFGNTIIRSGSSAEITAPAAKKARTSANGAAASRAKSIKGDIASPTPAVTTAAPANSRVDEFDDSDNEDQEASTADGKRDISTPLSTAEDKRRRNTAASARFRLKKKEREQAMEKRAKDLEGRVGELERECEALRRENGWLKGLVVGVTGSVPVPDAAAQLAGRRMSSSPTLMCMVLLMDLTCQESSVTARNRLRLLEHCGWAPDACFSIMSYVRISGVG